VPFGRFVLLEIHAFAGAASAAVPEYDLFRIGGPDLVPGRGREELVGSRAGAGSLGLGVRLTRSARVFLRGGVGNAWSEAEAVSLDDLRGGGSLGFVHNTALGPASIEFGAGAGRLRIYVSLGFQ
jgi:hypothetical protein